MIEKDHIIFVNSLIAGYGKKIILHEVNLKIKKEKTTALIGRNGVGKTTLLETLMGFIRPESGQIFFEGIDISSLKPHDISRMGISYVPQGRAIFPHMTVAEHIDIGGWNLQGRSEKLAAAEKVYSLFPILRDRRIQKAGTLSGGERQMLSIGRSMMSLPRVLLLDEPSFGLSPKMVESVFHRINQIRDDGVTVFLVEQNAKKALSNSDSGYVMDMGKVIFEGDSLQLLENENVKLSYLGVTKNDN